MSRKKFTDGWESLFETTHDVDLMEKTSSEHTPADISKKTRKPAANRQAAKKTRTSTGKSFTCDLESFLQEAFEDSFAEQTKQRSDSEPAPGAKTPLTNNAQGLDALIRSTINHDSISIDESGTGPKRLVLFLDEKKILKLKNIAKTEKTLLRNIIDQIVAEYIASYEKR
jgi:hypothetical protein